MIDLLGRERAEVLGEYVLDTGDTVRGAAKRFGVSKSTVHKDLTHRLSKINPNLAEQVREVLARNKSERHIRGGEATRIKYQKEKEKKS